MPGPTDLQGASPRPAARVQRLVEFALVAVIAVLAVVGFLGNLPYFLRLPQGQIDFAAYYLAARALNAGTPLYDRPAMEAQSVAAGGVVFTPYLYPPFWAHSLRPLALLPYPWAAALWLTANLAFLVLTIILLGRFIRLSPGAIAAWSVGVFLFPAVYDSLLLGQLTILITLLLVGALVLSASPHPSRGKDVLAGLLLGFAAALKLYPAIVLLVFLLRQRIVVVVAAGATAAGAFLLGVGLGGWPDTWRWFSVVLPSLSGNATTPVNQSLAGVVQRFFTTSMFYLDAEHRVVLSPLVNSPPLGWALIVIVTLLLLGISGVRIWRHVPPHGRRAVWGPDFALVVALMLLITPIAWDSYLVHLLIPLFVLWRYGCTGPSRLLLLGACLLLAVHRYWWILVPCVLSPWLLMFGFAGVVVVWAALLGAVQK